MKQWNIIGAIATVLALILSGMIYFSATLDSRIEDTLNNPEFIKKVADEIRLPFLIFDEQNSIIADTGAMKYIDKIEVIKVKSFPSLSKVIISPKSFIAIPPIIESIDDSSIGFAEPSRGEKFDLIYDSIFITSFIDSVENANSRRRFRLQFIVMPN